MLHPLTVSLFHFVTHSFYDPVFHSFFMARLEFAAVVIRDIQAHWADLDWLIMRRADILAKRAWTLRDNEICDFNTACVDEPACN